MNKEHPGRAIFLVDLTSSDEEEDQKLPASGPQRKRPPTEISTTDDASASKKARIPTILAPPDESQMIERASASSGRLPQAGGERKRPPVVSVDTTSSDDDEASTGKQARTPAHTNPSPNTQKKKAPRLVGVQAATATSPSTSRRCSNSDTNQRAAIPEHRRMDFGKMEFRSNEDSSAQSTMQTLAKTVQQLTAQSDQTEWHCEVPRGWPGHDGMWPVQ